MSEQIKRDKTYAYTLYAVSSSQSDYEVTTERVKDETTEHTRRLRVFNLRKRNLFP